MQKSREESIAEHRSVESVHIGSCISLRIARHSLPVTRIIVLVLVNAGINPGCNERKRIRGALECEVELLSWRKSCSVLQVGTIKGRNHTQYSLMLFLFQLLRRPLLLCPPSDCGCRGFDTLLLCIGCLLPVAF